MLRQSRCHSHCVPFGVNAVLVAAVYTLADEALASAVSLWPRQHRCLGAALDDREKARAAQVAPSVHTESSSLLVQVLVLLGSARNFRFLFEISNPPQNSVKRKQSGSVGRNLKMINEMRKWNAASAGFREGSSV